MPKSFYNELRKVDPDSRLGSSNKNDKSLFLTDNQIKEYFLCKDCEHEFNIQGEDYVIRECFKETSKFKLKDKISNSNEFSIKDSERWINPVSIKDFECGRYMYFAASIFWRASAWPRDIEGYKNALGPKYQEQFRLYLKGDARFPKNAYLEIYVDTGDPPIPIMLTPCVLSKRGCGYHEFIVPGIRFCLTLGAKAGKIQKLSNSENTKLFVIDSEFEKSERLKSLAKMYDDYSCKGKLNKSK